MVLCVHYNTFYYRPVSKVCGFSRETLIAITTDIESRELKRITNMEEGLPPEHPRAATTDDVEFSILRDSVGKHFTVKQVQYTYRKLSLEFIKRMDPELPFYYFTAAHDRFNEGPLPGFDQPRPREKQSRNPRHQSPLSRSAWKPGNWSSHHGDTRATVYKGTVSPHTRRTSTSPRC